MKDDTSIMVDLGDPKAKEIAEVIGNKTSNKILDYLANNEGTVTDISSDLKMPYSVLIAGTAWGFCLRTNLCLRRMEEELKNLDCSNLLYVMQFEGRWLLLTLGQDKSVC